MENFDYFKFCEEVFIQRGNFIRVYNRKPNRVIIPFKLKQELVNSREFIMGNQFYQEPEVFEIMGIPISWDFNGKKLYVGYVEESNYEI